MSNNNIGAAHRTHIIIYISTGVTKRGRGGWERGDDGVCAVGVAATSTPPQQQLNQSVVYVNVRIAREHNNSNNNN
jgi:hypothetical protein